VLTEPKTEHGGAATMPNPQWEEFNRKVIDEFRSNPGKVSGW